MKKIIDGYVIERCNNGVLSYIFDSPRLAWDNKETPQSHIDFWKKHACQPRCVTNRVVKVTVTLED